MIKQTFTRSFLVFFLLASSVAIGQVGEKVIHQDSLVGRLLSVKTEINKEHFETNYYAIQLYYGTYSVAKETITEFKTLFPEWETSLSFETPNYKVRVGNFKSYLIAIKKLEEVKRKYPSAFLLRPNNL